MPVINFATGNPALLPLLAEAGGAVIGVDWRIRLDDAWRTVGYDKAVQGNLDPLVLLAEPAEIRRRAKEDPRSGRRAAGAYLQPRPRRAASKRRSRTSIALVEAVRELSARRSE